MTTAKLSYTKLVRHLGKLAPLAIEMCYDILIVRANVEEGSVPGTYYDEKGKKYMMNKYGLWPQVGNYVAIAFCGGLVVGLLIGLIL